MYSPERRQGSGRTTLSPLPGFNPPWPLSSSSGRLQPPLPGVLQPFAIVLLEQVAHDDTAGSLIGRRSHIDDASIGRPDRGFVSIRRL